MGNFSKEDRMIIIAGNSHTKLAEDIAKKLDVELILANTRKFEDQELKVQIGKDLYEEDVVIIQSTAKPANDHLMELLLLADTAKRAGAKRIISVIPYFGYSRQDRHSYKHDPISASLVARLIESSGIDNVITLDLHSKQSEGFFKNGTENLDPSQLFISAFNDKKNYIVVSPDIGGLTRAQRMANLLGVDLAVLNKSRVSSGDCVMLEVIGNVTGKDCIIVDDIMDTGNTIFKAANLLSERGANSVSVCITHAVFSGYCVKKIEKHNFKKFYITDTIKQDDVPSNINVVSVNNLIIEALKKFVSK